MVALETSPSDAGFSSSRLDRVADVIASAIDAGQIAGAVTVVGRREQIVQLSAHGQLDLAAQRAMPVDALFRLASMTKPIVAVAIMQLFEAGQLLLEDPVARYLPAFADLQVADAAA